MSTSPKIGAGHVSAMGRLGLRELRNAANPSRESIADNELGLYGTSTPQDVDKIRQASMQPSREETIDIGR